MKRLAPDGVLSSTSNNVLSSLARDEINRHGRSSPMFRRWRAKPIRSGTPSPARLPARANVGSAGPFDISLHSFHNCGVDFRRGLGHRLGARNADVETYLSRRTRQTQNGSVPAALLIRLRISHRNLRSDPNRDSGG